MVELTEKTSVYERLSGKVRRQRRILSVTEWFSRFKQTCVERLVVEFFCFKLQSSGCLHPLVSFAELHSSVNLNALERDQLLPFVPVAPHLVDQLMTGPCLACYVSPKSRRETVTPSYVSEVAKLRCTVTCPSSFTNSHDSILLARLSE